ncbi:MAG: N-formylglutamate amidohydrolase [Candidatus Lokiarchaeota archaeon]
MDFKKYFEIGKGPSPVILSCPHGGYKKPSILDDKPNGASISDTNTFPIAKKIIQMLQSNNVHIKSILSKIHRSKMDLNRPPYSDSAYSQSLPSINNGKKLFQFYHSILQNYAKKCVYEHDRCLFLDLHGFTKPSSEYPDLILGTVFGKSLHIYNGPFDSEPSHYWGHSHLIKNLGPEFLLDDGMGVTNFNLGYSGGYITYQFLKSPKVNAIQIEIAKHIRINRKKVLNTKFCLPLNIFKY